jgi:hypothetical protein
VTNIVRDASPESWSSPEMKPRGGTSKKQKKSPEGVMAIDEMEMTNGGWAYSPPNGAKPDPIFQDLEGKKRETAPHPEEPASLELDIEADDTVSRNAFDQALRKHIDQAEIAETGEGTGLTPALEDVSMTDGGIDGGAAK